MFFLETIHIDCFDDAVPIADWVQMNKLANEQTDEYRYIGNSFGDDRRVYALFVNARADYKRIAVLINR